MAGRLSPAPVRPWQPGPVNYRTGLALLIAVVAVSDVIWLVRDTRPPRWDDAIHMSAAERIRQAGWSRGPAVAFAQPRYPPLVPVAGALVAAAGPRSADRYTAAMLPFVALLVVATAGLAARAWGGAAGWLAAVLVGLAPMTTYHLHAFMLDLPLAALVTGAVWALRERTLERRIPALLAGAVTGLAMLAKWTAVIYLVAPLAAAAWAAAAHAGWRRTAGGLAWLAAGAVLVAVPWYAAHTPDVLRYGRLVGYTSPDIAVMPLVTPSALLYYPGILWDGGGVAAALAVLAAVVCRRDPRVGPVLLNIVVPILLLTLLRNKNDRYALPILPFVAVAAAAVTAGWTRRTLRYVGGGIVAATAGLHLATVCGWTLIGRWGDPPVREIWPHREIVEAVAGDPSRSPSLAVIPDHRFVNADNVTVAALLNRIPVEVRGWHGAPGDSGWCLVKTGDPGGGSPLDAAGRAGLTARLLTGQGEGRLFRVRARWAAPDGGELILLVRRSATR